jgi:peptidase A4-like protein/putative Ig domain-containing protein
MIGRRLPRRRSVRAFLVVAAVAAIAAVGVAPARAATAKPVVTSLTASPARMPASGGSVVLLARVRGARTCTLRGQTGSNSTLRTIRTVRCAGGRASALAVVGQNTDQTPRSRQFTVTAVDKLGRRAQRTFTLVEAGVPVPLALASATLSPATVGQPYFEEIEPTGGTPGFTFALVSGSLPAGLALSSRGQITGTPTSPAGSSFTVSVTDARAQSATATITIPVGGGIPILTSPSEADGSTNWSGYSETGTFSGVTGTFTVPGVSASSSEDVVSEWVGLDGVVDGDDQVIQAGVEEYWDPAAGAPTVSAWWETWPAPSVPVQMTVAAGDRVTVTIGSLGGGSWRIQLSDLTTGQSFSTDQAYNGPGLSAEWIVEAPTDATTNALIDLAQFAPPVVFTSLFTSGTPSALQAIALGTDTGDGFQVSAVPSGVSGAGFSVAYGSTPPAAP